MHLSTAVRTAGARLGLGRAPISVAFEVTHRCNLSCRYCDRHTPRSQEMPTAVIEAVLDELVSMGMRTLSFDGGEPLVHPDIGALVERVRARGVRVTMNSNGILVERKLDVVRRVSKLKVSLDGPQAVHDAARGRGAFTRAVRGIVAARCAGVPVELTCVVGSHNADAVDELIALAARLGLRIVFQPERAGLVGAASHCSVRGIAEIRRAFVRIEQHKRAGRVVANRWASLRHFRSFPRDTPLPCAAGRINATLDPYGLLYACGQSPRTGEGVSVLAGGVRAAFEAMSQAGCEQCWCARVVEENEAWGGRVGRFLPPRSDSSEVLPFPVRDGCTTP